MPDGQHSPSHAAGCTPPAGFGHIPQMPRLDFRDDDIPFFFFIEDIASGIPVDRYSLITLVQIH